MTTYVASVGRSIGTTTELPLSAWAEFRRLMREAIESTGAVVVFDGAGEGQYKGAPEDAATIIAVGELGLEALTQLRRDFGDLAARYAQESIALTPGTTEFITPSRDALAAGDHSTRAA